MTTKVSWMLVNLCPPQPPPSRCTEEQACPRVKSQHVCVSAVHTAAAVIAGPGRLAVYSQVWILLEASLSRSVLSLPIKPMKRG